MTEAEALKIATHRHYKGGLYRFLFEAIHTETSETMVVYEHVWPHVQARFARPAPIFYGRLPDGQRRFDPIQPNAEEAGTC